MLAVTIPFTLASRELKGKKKIRVLKAIHVSVSFKVISGAPGGLHPWST